MTIDETKDELYRLLSDCVNNSYPIRNNTQKGRYKNAVKMAIASLEAWEKVRQEAKQEIESNWGFERIGEENILAIIDRHLQEVEDSTCDDCKTPCVMYEKGMRGCNPTGAEVLDKIRAELHATAEIHEDGDYYLREEWIDEIFDKYKASPTGAERSEE